jgi:quinol monooxygenase YgiN
MQEVMLMARLQAKPHQGDALEKELKALAEEVIREEPGCILYAFHRDNCDSTVFVSIERFVSQQAFDLHLLSTHLKKHSSRMKELLVEEPTLTFLTPIGSGQKGRL